MNGEEFLLLACVLGLLLTLCLGLIRVARGPTAADRMLSAQLFGTSGVAIFLLLSELRADPALRHVALVYALLAAVTVIAFVRRYPLNVQQPRRFGRSAKLAGPGPAAPGRLPESAAMLSVYHPEQEGKKGGRGEQHHTAEVFGDTTESGDT